MREKIIDQCLSLLKREDIKQEIKLLMSPLIEVIMSNIYPYIYLSLVFVIISFLLHLGIFILLIRNKPLTTAGTI
jgi:hypothetical protein